MKCTPSTLKAIISFSSKPPNTILISVNDDIFVAQSYGLEHIQDGRSVLAAFGTPLEEQAVDGSQRWNPKSLSIMVEKAKDERFQVQGKAQGKARKRLVEQNRKQKMQEKNI